MWFGRKNTFRTRRREKTQYRKRIIASGLSTLSVALILIAVWYGARRPEVTISSVSVEGGTTVPHEVVATKVESLLSGTYALLIPHRFAFLYPEGALRDAVNALPRVHSASVVRSSLHELTVTFEEYVPYALWCSSVETASSTPSCLFVDEHGLAFAPAPVLQGETLVRFVVEGRDPVVGQAVYDAATLADYEALINAISKNHERNLRALTETKDGDLILHLSQGGDLLITKKAHIQDVFENLESILKSDEYKDVPLEEFEYIDLRFGNKVYVKRRGVEVPAVSDADIVVPGSLLSTTSPSTTTATH